MNQCSVSELKKMIDSGERLKLIDVREPAEFNAEHIAGSILVPLAQIEQRADVFDPSVATYLICRSGSRGVRALERLEALGRTNVMCVSGGLAEWTRAGFPVEKGDGVWSLERQVRLAAGSLTLLGLILAFFTPWFLLLSAFVAAGLVFAAVTDSCGMAMLLARLPWNRRPCCARQA